MERVAPLFLLLIASACSSVAPIETTFVPSALAKDWVLGCQLGNGERGSFVSYVPHGQTCESHSETLYISNLDVPVENSSLGTYLKNRAAWLSKRGCARVTVLSQDLRQITWEEIPTSKCADRNYYELSKVMLGKESIQLIDYSNESPTPSVVAEWKKAFEDAHPEKDLQPSWGGGT